MDRDSQIPTEFHSEYLEGPFTKCLECEASLLEEDRLYVVQKSIVAGETVFEFAMCSHCGAKLAEEYSQESMQAVARFYQQAQQRRGIDPDELIDMMLESEGPHPIIEDERAHQPGTGECAFCGTRRDSSHRYSIAGMFLQSRPVATFTMALTTGSQFMACESCSRALAESISKKTRDSWDRFMDRHIDPLPELQFDPSDLLLV